MIFLGKEIGRDKYPFIVAEISCNHGGNIEDARTLVHEAKLAGADAVKIQVYTPDEMTLNMGTVDFRIEDGPWNGYTLYELYNKTQTNFEMAGAMWKTAEELDIPIFASVFGEDGLAFLENIKCPAYKIASFELTDTNLIRKVAKTGKPVVLSTGLACLDDIIQADICVNPDNSILLHCVSAYPTRISQANLWKIQSYENMFKQPIGFSDHTNNSFVGPLAVAMGARLIEKHLMLVGTDTEDGKFSLYPNEFKTYVYHCRKAAEATFKVDVPEEEQSRQFRRSLYVVKNIKRGEIFTLDNIKAIRPNHGLPAYKLTSILGKICKSNIKAGTALKQENIL